MDDAASPCPVPSSKLSAGSEYATLTPLAPMSYTAVPQTHQHVEQSAALYPHHQQPMAATVAVFPTFFCGGAVPEMTSTTSSLELQDLPPAVTGVPSPDFSVNSDSDDSSSDKVRHVNDGFERLRSRLPLPPRDKDRRLSKVETLRYAISYIRHLQRLLGLIDDDDDDEDCENSRCHR
nr:achaete-scute homolog 2-like [Rhipicephalus microplus]